MTDLTVSSSTPSIEPPATPSSAEALDASDNAPEAPAPPAYDFGGCTQEVPAGYVSDAELLAWLQAKSSGQYGELDQLMDTSNARSELVKDLSHLKETLANMTANPESALAEIEAMRAAYAGTEYAAELDELLAPFRDPLKNYVDAMAAVNAVELSGMSNEEAAAFKAEHKSKIAAAILPETGVIDSTIKDLEHDDQLALVQIQALMSEIRETAQLTSNIIANRSQTADSIVGNIPSVKAAMDPVTSRPTPAPPECEPPAASPREDAAIPTDDLGAALLALVMRSIHGRSEQATASVEQANDLVERARAEVAAAMKRAEEAEESAGFWGDLREVLGGDLATLASVVAATAVVIGTGGLGAPAVLAIAAAGLSAGATVGSRLGLDPKVCALLGTAGALLGVAGGGFGSAGSLATLATGARAVQAGATAASGGAMVVEGEYRGRSLHARAEKETAEQKERDAHLDIDLAIQVLEDAARDIERARRATSAIQATEDGTRSAVIARMGAA